MSAWGTEIRKEYKKQIGKLHRLYSVLIYIDSLESVVTLTGSINQQGTLLMLIKFRLRVSLDIHFDHVLVLKLSGLSDG